MRQRNAKCTTGIVAVNQREQILQANHPNSLTLDLDYALNSTEWLCSGSGVHFEVLVSGFLRITWVMFLIFKMVTEVEDYTSVTLTRFV